MQPHQRRSLHPARPASPPCASSGSLKPSFCVEGANGKKPSGGASQASRPRKQPPLPKKSPSRTSGTSMYRETSCSGSSETSVDDAMSSIGIGVPQGSSPPMMLALLQAAPLVHGGVAVDQLDLKHERDIVLGALRRSGKRATVVTDFCTTRRLRDLLTDGCRILHYSGHGFSFVDRNGVAQARLAFENGEGGTHFLEVQNLTDLVAAGADGDGAPPLDFAFISACHSVGGGEAFVAAGVPHVVAVRREAQLQDRAACMFAEAFYYALFKGRTVRQAFRGRVQGQDGAASPPPSRISPRMQATRRLSHRLATTAQVRQAFDIGREAVKNQPHILRAGMCMCTLYAWCIRGACTLCAWCMHTVCTRCVHDVCMLAQGPTPHPARRRRVG